MKLTIRQIREATKAAILPILVFAMFIGFTEYICRAWAIPLYLFPPPSAVFHELQLRAAVYVRHTLITAGESLAGFAIATLLAYICGVLFVYSKTAERALYPYAIALKAVPIVALAPILILWFGAGILGKIVMAAVVSFFPVVVAATAGLRAPARDSLDLFKSLGASRTQVFWLLRFPSAMPQLFSALKVSATLSVVGALVGELTGSLYGLGFIIMNASYEVDAVRMFAGILCASIVGVVLFYAVVLVERRVLFWHESVNGNSGGQVIRVDAS